MGLRRKIIYLFLIILSFHFYNFQGERDYYTEGNNSLEKGSWIKTSRLWEMGKAVLEKNGLCDPRIAFDYIAMVTEQTKPFFYDKASTIYMWGLSGSNVAEYMDTICEEAERTIPLLEDEEAEEWKELIKNKDPELITRLKGFWTKKDPTPGTPKNERLIEHWERIAYARKNFLKNKISVYGCDPSGVVYVRYGEPDRRSEGSLGTNMTEIDIIIGNYEPNTDRNPDAKVKIIKANTGREITRMDIAAMQWSPEYDIWMYDSLDEEESVVYSFGQPEGRSYILLDGIDQLIPKSAYSGEYGLSNTGTSPFTGNPSSMISIGALIQVQYYSELVAVDSYFARRYDELYSEWRRSQIGGNKPPLPAVIEQYRYRYIHEDKENPYKKYAPMSTSGFESTIINIPVISTQLRILDENDVPKMAVIAMSFPGIQSDLSIAELLADPNIEQDYIVKHTLLIHDSNWDEIGRMEDIREESHDNTSMFLIDHKTGTNNYILSAEAEPKDWDKLGELQIGKAVLDSPEPLSPDYSKLEISDIIAGMPIPNELKSDNYPFPVIPVRQVFNDDPLMVYVEVYHLALDPDGRAQFDIEFSYKTGYKGKETVSQKFPFQSTSTTAKEVAGFDVSGLKPGEYEFTIEVTDKISGQKKSRRGMITIAEEEKD